MNIGTKTMNIVTKFMNIGSRTMNIGLKFMNMGTKTMNIGLKFMNMGTKTMNDAPTFMVFAAKFRDRQRMFGNFAPVCTPNTPCAFTLRLRSQQSSSKQQVCR